MRTELSYMPVHSQDEINVTSGLEAEAQVTHCTCHNTSDDSCYTVCDTVCFCVIWVSTLKPCVWQ